MLPAAAGASFGDAQILAPFPANPGFPEGVAVRDGKVFAAGAATFGTTGAGPSAVLSYDRATGAQVARHDASAENLLAGHGSSSIAFDGEGRPYALNTQLGTYRLDAQGNQQSYTPAFPDLKPCLPPLVSAPCSPTVADLPALPNDIAFAPNGDAYVTDSTQATIWRIPKGGGTPKIWYQDSRFASPYIGTNGLRLSPDGTRVFVTVTTDVGMHADARGALVDIGPAEQRGIGVLDDEDVAREVEARQRPVVAHVLQRVVGPADVRDVARDDDGQDRRGLLVPWRPQSHRLSAAPSARRHRGG